MVLLINYDDVPIKFDKVPLALAVANYKLDHHNNETVTYDA